MGATMLLVDEHASSGDDTAAITESYPVKARKLLRETLLDAALAELGQRNWDQITMADIARRAGVSRQTLYKEFGSRDEFSQAFVLREGERFLAMIEQAILDNRADSRMAIEAAFEVFLRAGDEHPLVRSALVGSGADTILPLVTTQGGPIIEFATVRLAGTIAQGWPQAPNSDVKLLAENLVRLGISYLTVHTRSPSETAVEVSRLLGPFADWATGGATEA